MVVELCKAKDDVKVKKHDYNLKCLSFVNMTQVHIQKAFYLFRLLFPDILIEDRRRGKAS